MLEESDNKDQWPDAWVQKDWDAIIKLWAKQKIEKHYNQEIQKLCKTSCFGTVFNINYRLINKSLSKKIVEVATITTFFISSIVFSIGLIRFFYGILRILC